MDLITIPQAAKLLRLKPHAVYRMIRTQVLPPGIAVRFGRSIRISRPNLEEFCRDGGQALPGGWKRTAA